MNTRRRSNLIALVLVLVLGACGIEQTVLEMVTEPDAKVLRQDADAAKSTTTTTRPGGPLPGAEEDEIYGWDAIGKGTTPIEFNALSEWEPENAETVFTWTSPLPERGTP